MPVRTSILPAILNSDESDSVVSQGASSDTKPETIWEAPDFQQEAVPNNPELSPTTDLFGKVRLSWSDGDSPSSICSQDDNYSYFSSVPRSCSSITSPVPIAPSFEALYRIANIIGSAKFPRTFYWHTPGEVMHYRKCAVDSIDSYDHDGGMLMAAGD